MKTFPNKKFLFYFAKAIKFSNAASQQYSPCRIIAPKQTLKFPLLLRRRIVVAGLVILSLCWVEKTGAETLKKESKKKKAVPAKKWQVESSDTTATKEETKSTQLTPASVGVQDVTIEISQNPLTQQTEPAAVEMPEPSHNPLMFQAVPVVSVAHPQETAKPTQNSQAASESPAQPVTALNFQPDVSEETQEKSSAEKAEPPVVPESKSPIKSESNEAQTITPTQELLAVETVLPESAAPSSALTNPVILPTESKVQVVTPVKTDKEMEQLDFANGLFERGMYQLAIEEFNEFIKDFPNSPYLPDAYYGLAESYFFLDNYVEALPAFAKFKGLYPQDKKMIMATLRIGQSYFFTGKYDEAAQNLNSIRDENLDEDSTQTLFFYLAKSLKAKGNGERAIEYFQKTTEMKNSVYTAHAFLEKAELDGFAAKYDEAIEAYKKAEETALTEDVKSVAIYRQGEMQFLAGQYPDAVTTFRKILAAYPTQTIAQDALANLLLAMYNQGQYQELITEYQNHENLLPATGGFNIHYITASALAEMEKYEEAQALLDQVLKIENLSPEDKSQATVKKSEIMIKSGQYKEALSALGEDIEKNSQAKDQLLFLKAEALYGAGEYNQAFDLYQKIKTEFPSSDLSVEAIYGMAYARNAAGQEKEAADLFFEYFQRGKDDAKRQSALYNEILLSRKQANLDQAIEHAELYLTTFKEGKQIQELMFLLGNLYPKVKKHDRSTAVLKDYLARFPQSDQLPEVNFLLGYNLQMSGNTDEALTYYQQLSLGDPDKKLYYSALKNSGVIHLSKNNDDQAAEIFEKIIREFEKNDLDLKTYIWLAQKNLNVQKYDEALNILSKVQANLKDADPAAVAYLQGEAYRGKKEFENAVRSYDVVLGKDLNIYSGPSRIGKGLALAALQKYESALTEFQMAIKENIDDNTISMKARFEIAGLERARNNLEEAAKHYMSVAVLYNNKDYGPRALYNAGELFESLQKKEDAIKAYQELVNSYKESPLSDKAQERIKALSES